IGAFLLSQCGMVVQRCGPVGVIWRQEVPKTPHCVKVSTFLSVGSPVRLF
ncbi:hypothetical protein BDV23DRAFT_160678, partial [Aspergillus alliaceus]